MVNAKNAERQHFKVSLLAAAVTRQSCAKNAAGVRVIYHAERNPPMTNRIDEPKETHFAVEYVPSFAERFWRRLGYRYHLQDVPETDMPGWMMTKTVIHFDFADRLRLLFSGRLKLDTRQATNVVVDKCISTVSFSISPPFGERHD